MRILLLAGGALLALSTTATAQTADPYAPREPLPYDRGYDLDQPRTRAINEIERPAVEAANEEALAQAEAQTASGGVDMAQYDADMARYRAQLAARDTVAAADAAFYARQEQAYADAMADWRVQVEDCHAGIRAACNAPTPDPADY